MGTAIVTGKEKEERNKASFSSIHEGGSILDADPRAISGTFRELPFYFLFQCPQQGILPSIPLHSMRESLPFF